MRRVVILGLAITPLLSGCNIAYYSAHNLVNEPLQAIKQHKLHHRMRAEAHATWQAECARTPGAFSRAYADGFVDGYADHLNNGGTPAPPSVPPPHYRRHASDFTPTGQAAQRDYMAGFKHGAEAACAAGSRQDVVVPIRMPSPLPEPPLNIICIPASPESPKIPPAGPPPMPPPVPPPGFPLPLPLPVPAPHPLPAAKPGPVPRPVPPTKGEEGDTVWWPAKPVPPAGIPNPGAGPNVRGALPPPLLLPLEREGGATTRPGPVIPAGGGDRGLPKVEHVEWSASGSR